MKATRTQIRLMVLGAFVVVALAVWLLVVIIGHVGGRRCPQCRDIVDNKAVRCEHCGSALPEPDRRRSLSREDRLATGRDMSLDDPRANWILLGVFAGAGVLVLEELEHAKARGAHIYAEVLGFAATCDAYHITAPEPSGVGAALSMTRALSDAGLDATDIDYINAHGTSTQLNDSMETRAIKTALGDHARPVAISSTKSMIGHLLGASGGAELVATVLTIERGVITPTINYEYPDPECNVDVVANVPRERQANLCLKLSYGFGGHNSCLVLSRT